jgi:hypothetical protein
MHEDRWHQIKMLNRQIAALCRQMRSRKRADIEARNATARKLKDARTARDKLLSVPDRP